MLRNLKEYECECGCVHRIKTKKIIVDNDAYQKLLEELKYCDQTKILIFSSLKDSFLIDKLSLELSKVNKNVERVVLVDCNATIMVAEQIKNLDCGLVVALGTEPLISVAKYYSYMINSGLYIFPIGNFCDYTFSKFARLFDGVEYAFYSTVEPEKVFVSTAINKYNQYQTSFIMSKQLSFFDSVVSELVFNQKVCEKAKEYFKTTLDDYKFCNDEKQMNLKNIWTLIRIGLAISFFDQTKCFYGGELAITNLLQAQNISADFLEINTISTKFVFNLYSCFFKKFPKQNDVNINKQIAGLSMLLNVSSLEVIKRIVGSEFLVGEDMILNRFSNYYHYLKQILKKCIQKMFRIKSNISLTTNISKKYNFTAKRLEKTFALSHTLFIKPCCLHLFSAFGYMDILL